MGLIFVTPDAVLQEDGICWRNKHGKWMRCGNNTKKNLSVVFPGKRNALNYSMTYFGKKNFVYEIQFFLELNAKIGFPIVFLE